MRIEKKDKMKIAAYILKDYTRCQAKLSLKCFLLRHRIVMRLALTYKEILGHPDKKSKSFNMEKNSLRLLHSNMQHIQYKMVKLYQSMHRERNGESHILNSTIVLLQ